LRTAKSERYECPPGIGVYICHCGTNIVGSVDVKKVAESASIFPNVIVAREYPYVCSDAGQALIKQDINNLKLDRVVIAACSPTLHESRLMIVTLTCVCCRCVFAFRLRSVEEDDEEFF